MTHAEMIAARLQRKIDFVHYFHELIEGEPVLLDDADSRPWFDEGVICEVSEELYTYYLETLPPRWLDGDSFAFGDATGPFRLFWKRGDRYLGRELTAEETLRFCQLSGTIFYE